MNSFNQHDSSGAPSAKLPRADNIQDALRASHDVIDNHAAERCWAHPLSNIELADVRSRIDAAFGAAHDVLRERADPSRIYCLAAFGDLQCAARDAFVTYTRLSEGVETMLLRVSELFMYRVQRLSADLVVAAEDDWPTRMLEDEIRSLGKLTLIVLRRPNDAPSQYEFLGSEILRIEKGEALERELVRVVTKVKRHRLC